MRASKTRIDLPVAGSSKPLRDLCGGSLSNSLSRHCCRSAGRVLACSGGCEAQVARGAVRNDRTDHEIITFGKGGRWRPAQSPASGEPREAPDARHTQVQYNPAASRCSFALPFSRNEGGGRYADEDERTQPQGLEW